MRKSILLLLLIVLAGGQPAASDEPDCLVQFFLMAREIQSINLVNGLYLSADQAAELAVLARKSEDSKAALEKTLEGRKGDLAELLASMRAELVGDGRLSAKTTRRHHEIMGEVEKALGRHRSVTADLTQRTRSVLNENQLELVARFKPCLVPPEASKEARTGGSSGSHVEKGLEDIRKLPAWLYPFAKRKGLGELRTKLTAWLGPEEAERKLQIVEETFDKARSLTDEEFALQREELARTIDPRHAPRQGAELDKMIADHLLSPGALAVLERLAVVSR